MYKYKCNIYIQYMFDMTLLRTDILTCKVRRIMQEKLESENTKGRTISQITCFDRHLYNIK